MPATSTEREVISFGTLHPDGTTTDEKVLNKKDIQRCPWYIMDPVHYRADGSCRCNDPVEQARLIKHCGYKKSHFKNKKEITNVH